MEKTTKIFGGLKKISYLCIVKGNKQQLEVAHDTDKVHTTMMNKTIKQFFGEVKSDKFISRPIGGCYFYENLVTFINVELGGKYYIEYNHTLSACIILGISKQDDKYYLIADVKTADGIKRIQIKQDGANAYEMVMLYKSVDDYKKGRFVEAVNVEFNNCVFKELKRYAVISEHLDDSMFYSHSYYYAHRYKWDGTKAVSISLTKYIDVVHSSIFISADGTTTIDGKTIDEILAPNLANTYRTKEECEADNEIKYLDFDGNEIAKDEENDETVTITISAKDLAKIKAFGFVIS